MGIGSDFDGTERYIIDTWLLKFMLSCMMLEYHGA